MQDNSFIDFDSYLEIYDDPQKKKLEVYEAVLASVLRKYVPSGKKIEINLKHLYRDTYLDMLINNQDESVVKISWGEVDAGIQ